MAINNDPRYAWAQNLTPQQLAEILGIARKPEMYATTEAGPQLGGGFASLGSGQFDPSISWLPDQITSGYGESAVSNNDPSGSGRWQISQPRNLSLMGGSDSTGMWDENGNWQGFGTSMADMRGVATILAMAAGGAYANGGWGDGLQSLGEAGGYGFTSPESAGTLTQLGEAGGYAGTGGTTVGTTAGAGTTSAGTGATTAGGSSLATGVKTAVDALGGGKGIAGLVGAAAGALDSGDKEQTTSRDPWSAAQPYLKGLLAEGADIYNRQKAEPFNKEQQAGYANIGGLLDLVNRNAGGLLAGPQANASGANQFQRGRPGLLQGTTFAPTAAEWNPQGFGDFGMTRYRGGR